MNALVSPATPAPAAPVTTAAPVTLTSLYREILAANLVGNLYADPPRYDAERNERLDVLVVEGLIDAAELDGVSGWLVKRER